MKSKRQIVGISNCKTTVDRFRIEFQAASNFMSRYSKKSHAP